RRYERPSTGHDRKNLAWNDEAVETPSQGDHAYVGRSEGKGQPLSGLVRQKHDVPELQPLSELHDSASVRPVADDGDPELLNCPETRRRMQELVEILRCSDVTRIHHDELIVEAVL